MAAPRTAIDQAEQRATLLPGNDERFSGWGLMGLTFRSGDILGTRRFPACSVGDGYSSVWYRDPSGVWTFYCDVPSDSACPRYFGSALARSVQCPVTLEWVAGDRLRVSVPEGRLSAEILFGESISSHVMNLMAAAFPERAWRSPRMLRLTAAFAGPMLRAGKLSMSGVTPNHQGFIANPRKLWVVKSAKLTVGDRETDQLGPVVPQARLGDFLIPQRGLLAIGNAAFDAFDPARHSSAVSAVP